MIVVARVRPLNRKEIEMGTQICLNFNPNKKDITLNLGKEYQGAFGEQKFTFDRIFDVNSTQKEIYDCAAKPIIDSNIQIILIFRCARGFQRDHLRLWPDIIREDTYYVGARYRGFGNVRNHSSHG